MDHVTRTSLSGRLGEEGESRAAVQHLGGVGGECRTSGAQAGPGGSGHRPAPKMVNLLLLQPEPSMPNTALLIKNPLAATHEFKQACQLCYPKTGKATPLCSAPLPRGARDLRSVESQNEGSPVHPSERSLGRQKPCWLFRVARDVREGRTFKTARGWRSGSQETPSGLWATFPQAEAQKWGTLLTQSSSLRGLPASITATPQPRGWLLAVEGRV